MLSDPPPGYGPQASDLILAQGRILRRGLGRDGTGTISAVPTRTGELGFGV